MKCSRNNVANYSDEKDTVQLTESFTDVTVDGEEIPAGDKLTIPSGLM